MTTCHELGVIDKLIEGLNGFTIRFVLRWGRPIDNLSSYTHLEVSTSSKITVTPHTDNDNQMSRAMHNKKCCYQGSRMQLELDQHVIHGHGGCRGLTPSIVN